MPAREQRRVRRALPASAPIVDVLSRVDADERRARCGEPGRAAAVQERMIDLPYAGVPQWRSQPVRIRTARPWTSSPSKRAAPNDARRLRRTSTSTPSQIDHPLQLQAGQVEAIGDSGGTACRGTCRFGDHRDPADAELRARRVTRLRRLPRQVFVDDCGAGRPGYGDRCPLTIAWLRSMRRRIMRRQATRPRRGTADRPAGTPCTRDSRRGARRQRSAAARGACQ